MSRQKGNQAEQRAVLFLKQNGFKILEQNFTIKGGEIDIIAAKDMSLHFVEVKSGTTFEPVQNITPQKISRIIKTAQTYMQRKSLDMAFCIDAIIIKNENLEFIENITI